MQVVLHLIIYDMGNGDGPQCDVYTESDRADAREQELLLATIPEHRRAEQCKLHSDLHDLRISIAFLGGLDNGVTVRRDTAVIHV